MSIIHIDDLIVLTVKSFVERREIYAKLKPTSAIEKTIDLAN